MVPSAIRHPRLVGNAMIVSDDARQSRVGTHALGWVHADQLLHKLMPSKPRQMKYVETLAARLCHQISRAYPIP